MANWTFNFIVSLTFLLLIEALGRTGAFWFYGGDRHAHPLVLLEVRPGDEGQAAGGHPGSASKRGPGSRAATRDRARSYPRPMRVDEIIAGEATDLLGRVLPAEDRRRATKQLFETARQLRELEPDFVSVTYGAGGSTRDGTVEITRALKDDLGFETMAHLSCVGETTEGLAATLDKIAAAGIENVFALRGDPPRGRERLRPARGRARQRRRADRLHRRRAGTSPSAAPASRRCTPRRPTWRPTSPT